MVALTRTQGVGSVLILTAWVALVAVPWAVISYQFALPGNMLTILAAALLINYLSRPSIDIVEQKVGAYTRQNSVIRQRFFRERVRNTRFLKLVMLPPVSSIAAGAFLFVLLAFASRSAWRDGAKWWSATSCLLLYSWAVIALIVLCDLTAEYREGRKAKLDGSGTI